MAVSDVCVYAWYSYLRLAQQNQLSHVLGWFLACSLTSRMAEYCMITGPDNKCFQMTKNLGHAEITGLVAQHPVPEAYQSASSWFALQKLRRAS